MELKFRQMLQKTKENDISILMAYIAMTFETSLEVYSAKQYFKDDDDFEKACMLIMDAYTLSSIESIYELAEALLELWLLMPTKENLSQMKYQNLIDKVYKMRRS